MRRRRCRVLWTLPALNGLKRIALYIRAENPPAAKRFATHVRKKVDRLSHFPQLGRVVPEFPESGLRELIHGNYRIIYRVHPDTVAIVSVYHGQRLLDREPGS